MARIDSDPLTVPGAADTQSDSPEAMVDLTAAAGVVEVPPALVAQSMGEYLRVYWQRVRGGDSGVLPVVVGIIVVYAAFQIADSRFLGAQNVVNLLEQCSIYMLLAMAEIFALLLGEIDLSVGLVMGLAAVTVAELVQPSGAASCALCPHGLDFPWWLAIITTLLICMGVGAVQGTMVARFKMPSFIVTLGGLLILEGVALIVLNGNPVRLGNLQLYDIFWGHFSTLVGWILLVVTVVAVAAAWWFGDASRRRRGLVAPPASFTAIKIAGLAVAGVVVVVLCNENRAHFGVIEGVPYLIPIVLAVLFIWTMLLQRTRFGRYVYAIGGNPEAARRAGVSLPSVRTWCFVLAALTAGIAGILFASWQVFLTTNIIKSANSYVLLAVAAAVIGGTSLFGGRGKTIHGVLGGVVIGGIYNGLYLLGVTSEWVDVLIAVVLLAAGTIDVLSRGGARSRA
ncbi:MAG: ABC transporter permease [Candidatus Dormibacteria bacterium]|jgi:D-xylose transport system permease protein